MSAHTPITPKRARRGASASHASALGAHPQGQAPLAPLWPLWPLWPLCALICALFTALGGAGCLEVGLLSDSSPALLTTPAGGGPVVRYDLLARPLPELPLPNDDATRYDPTSATGRRLNVSLLAPTLVERRAREGFDELDGFGTYAPITVSFDAPIDVLDLHARHNAHDPGAGLFRDDFRDDAVYLLNVDPSCARFGEEVALDVGRGRFPATLYKHLRATPDALAPEGRRVDFDDLFHLSRFDPHATANNILFEEWSEDLNGDGRLSPEEDRDGDGRLDRANLLREEACAGLAEGTVERSRCVADELMTFYDRSSNTLVLRPVWPLEQRCTYAAVLTNRLKGLGGEPARSPFAGRAAKSHEARLAPLGGLLARYGLTLEDVAFAWVFTTGTATRDLEALRAGLYGVGPFAALADQHPVTSLHIWTRGELDVDNELPASVKEDRLLPGPCVGLGVNKYWLVRGEWSANLCAIEADMAGLSGVFGGTFSAPDLLVDRVRSPSSAPLSSPVSEPHPADSADERWEVEAHSGRLVSGAAEVTFLCALPEERAEGCAPGNPEGAPFCKPFPTILYAHGYGGSRAEIIVGHVGRTTSMGYAMCALDAYGHGLNVLLEDNPLAREAALAFSVLRSFGVPDFKRLLMLGRDRDLNNDNVPDSGADMWTSDIFHTRDMVRQTSLEYSQFVRILRSFDGVRRDAEGRLLGDIDGDGRVDLAGPLAPVGMWGISLGGIISGVMAGLEPALDAVSPNAGGGGLVDIAVRSSQAGVPQAVLLPVLGPFIVGCMATDDHQRPIAEGEGKSCFRGDGGAAQLKAGELELAFMLNSNARQLEVPFAVLRDVRAGDWVELENLSNGQVKRRRVSARGGLMLSVPADALSARERRGPLGLMEGDAEPRAPRSTLELGDALVVRHFSAEDGEGPRDPQTGEMDTERALEATPRAELRTFEREVVFQGARYQAGEPLVALQEGLGLERNDPRFRRFMGLAQHAIGPGDPAIWSAHISLEPLDVPYGDYRGGRTRVLQMPTAGDQQVPVNTGVAAARVSGVMGSWLRDEVRFPDPRYGWRELFQPLEGVAGAGGRSADQLLIERFVVEGDASLARYPTPISVEGVELLVDEGAGEGFGPYTVFDIDDVSDGAARFSCGDDDWSAQNGESLCSDEQRSSGALLPVPRLPEGLRLTRPRAGGGVDALRVPVLRPAGQHGIYNAQPFRTFDADAFMVNLTTRYLGTGGELLDHPGGCDCSASAIPSYSLNGAEVFPVRGARACGEEELRVCSPECARAWGISSAERVACVVPE